MRYVSLIFTAVFLLSCLWQNLSAQSITQDYRYVEIAITTQSPNVNNRNYKAVNTALMSIVRCNAPLSAYSANGNTNTYTSAPTATATPTPTPAATPTPTPSQQSSTPTPTPAPTATPTPSATPVSAQNWWNWWNWGNNNNNWGW